MAVFHFDSNGGAWLRDHTHTQLTTLKARIDGGTPVTVGLIGTTWNPMDNHQVLCYGYNNNGDGTTTLFLYDNNAPGVETTTKLDFSGSSLSAVESRPSAARGPLRGLFCTSYGAQTPPKAVVLHSGLTISPPHTGLNQPVGLQLSAANIGFHNSPNFQLLAADGSNMTQEAAPASVAEGASRSFPSHLTFNTPGVHHVSAVANLGNFAGIQITKQVPPEGNSQSPSANVLVFQERDIRTVSDDECSVVNVANGSPTFTIDTADMGAGVTYQWTVTGAAIQGSHTSQHVTLNLPAQEGATVTINVKASLPDGAFATGTDSFKTISVFAAQIQHITCQVAHIITTAPFWIDPGDPDPDRFTHVNPGDLVSIRDVATNLVNVANSAIKANVPIALTLGIRATRANLGAPVVKVNTPVVTPSPVVPPKGN